MGWNIVNDLTDPEHHFSTITPICGDNITVSEDQCDDGNTIPWDGCSDTCTEEVGWTFVNHTNNDTGLLYTVATEICGDNIVVGLNDPCDGPTCKSDCSDGEIGWTCIGGD